jgi:hypothetical protein
MVLKLAPRNPATIKRSILQTQEKSNQNVTLIAGSEDTIPAERSGWQSPPTGDYLK